VYVSAMTVFFIATCCKALLYVVIYPDSCPGRQTVLVI